MIYKKPELKCNHFSMALIGELHFWTLKDDIFIKDSDIGCFRVYDKGGLEPSVENPFEQDKQEYAEARGITCNTTNKRPEKLRDNLKELEELLNNNRCVSLKWDACSPLQIVFNNGVIASLFCNAENTNIDSILLDSYLTGKLVSDHVVDVIIDGNYLLISYVEPKLTCVYLNKASFNKSNAVFTPKRVEKLSSLVQKLTTVDLVGPGGRRMERRLSLNSSKDCVLVWWHNAVDEVWPWTPINSTQDRTNLLVYSLNGPVIELLCSARIDAGLIIAKFSYYHPNQVFTLEENVTRNGDFSVDVCVYEIARGRCLQVSLTTIPLQGHVLSSCWSPSEDKLLLSCDDCSLVMYDVHCHVTHLATTQYLVMELAWHPSGTVVIVSGERGQLQCFDAALSCVKLQLMTEDMSPTDILEMPMHFKHQPSIFQLLWQQNRSVLNVQHARARYDTLCLLFETGPLVFLRFSLGIVTQDCFTPLELIIQYHKSGQVDEAVCLLLSLDWSRQGELCFQCLQHIVNYLLRKPLNHNREAQLEAALGTFYNPSQPLPEMIVIEYRDQVGHLARRFFHKLLRFQRLEKAFLLAVDLGCRDLFLDLHHVAKDKGERALAEVALSHAKELADNSTTGSDSGDSVGDIDNLTEFSDDSSREDYPLRNHQQFPQGTSLIHKAPPSSEPSKSGGIQMRSDHPLTERCVMPPGPLQYKWPVLCSPVKQDECVAVSNNASQPEICLIPNTSQCGVNVGSQNMASHVLSDSPPFNMSKSATSLHMIGDRQLTIPKSSFNSSISLAARQNQLAKPHNAINNFSVLSKQNQVVYNKVPFRNDILSPQQDLDHNNSYVGNKSNRVENAKEVLYLSGSKPNDSRIFLNKFIDRDGTPSSSRNISNSIVPDECINSIASQCISVNTYCEDLSFSFNCSNNSALSVRNIHKENDTFMHPVAKKVVGRNGQDKHQHEEQSSNEHLTLHNQTSNNFYMQDNLDEEDIEGTRVKFVHFGVV